MLVSVIGYKILLSTTLIIGQPSDQMINSLPKPAILILDDLMLSLPERWLSDMFTKRSHHEQFSIILLCQNLFEKALKVARVNSQYICLMRSPSAQLQIRNLGTQLFPRQLAYFIDAYKKATEQPYGYLFLDLHAASNPLLKLRTNIIEQDSDSVSIFQSPIIFTPI